MSKELPFETENLPNGNKNPKYIDLLDEDKPVAGQKWVCMSFVSPDKILKKKDLFLFEEFLKHWDYSKGVQKFSQFLNFISYKYNMNFDKIMNDYQEFIKSEESDLVKTSIGDDYKNFLDAKEEELEKVFNEMHNFQTNTRGVKVRGAYPSREEAELRCKLLRELDPNHDIYVGPVGTWVPWEPEAYRTGRVEYLNDELNQLMHEKNKNEKQAKREFEKRVSDAKKKAIEDNKKLAKETGNKLTQNIDADGNLVGVGSSTVENNLKSSDQISSADIRKELFEGENIRTRDTDKAQRKAEESTNIDISVSEKKGD